VTSVPRTPSPRPTAAPATTTTTPTTTTTRLEPDPTTTSPVVEYDGRRYEVGEPGDVALVGPWFCDGRDVVALLRPSNGSVHVFTEWAPAASTLEARSVASVPGATGLTRVPDGPECAVLVVGSGSADLRTLTAEDLR
jgi:hypothetical protein